MGRPLVPVCWLLAALAVHSVLYGQDAGRRADWRVYGNFEKDGKVYATLYSVPDIARSPGLLRVWTQASSITTADTDRAIKDQSFLAIVAGRIRARYMPPVNSVEKINDDQVIHIIVLEEVANERKVDPAIMMLEEIDCKRLRNRYLSIQTYWEGSLASSTDQPGKWSYITPHSNDRNLATLVCDPQLTAPDNTPVPHR